MKVQPINNTQYTNICAQHPKISEDLLLLTPEAFWLLTSHYHTLVQ